jgi:hypothetical protein
MCTAALRVFVAFYMPTIAALISCSQLPPLSSVGLKSLLLDRLFLAKYAYRTKAVAAFTSSGPYLGLVVSVRPAG